MNIATKKKSTIVLSKMPIVEQLGMPSCWVLGLDRANQDGRSDRLILEVVLESSVREQFVHEMLSPRIRALRSEDLNFDTEDDAERSGWCHTEVVGNSAYILALADVAEALGAIRGTYRFAA